MARFAKAVLAAGIAVALALSLTGCSKTVTYKYRSLVGLYWVCTGPSWMPCGKGSVWRVSKAEYDKIVVGKTYNL